MTHLHNFNDMLPEILLLLLLILEFRTQIFSLQIVHYGLTELSPTQVRRLDQLSLQSRS